MRTIGLGRLSASALVGLLLTAAPALAQPYSIRFFGTGTNDIDRIKIRIDDPARPVDVAGDFTIEFWMKATGGTTSACQTGSFNWVYGNIIIDRDIFGSGDFGDYGISMRGGRIAFGVGSASQDQTICSSTAVNDGAWHHVAVTRASATGQMRIYIDGTQRASGTGPTGDISYRNGRSTNAPDDPFLVFGAEKHDAGGSFPSYNGLLDEVRVSRVVRYSSNFTRPAAPFTTDGNTVGLYHLDDGPGAQTAIDTSGASGGPSHGVVRYGSGGQANRPSWSTDVPFGGSPPPPPSCTYTLSSSGTNVGAGIVNGSVNVTAPGGCGWTATSNVGWLTITTSLPKSGSGTLTFRTTANPSSTARTGTLTIAGKTFTVTQAGAGCTFSLSLSGANIGAGVVNGSVNVTAPGGCGWTATTNAPSWLTITGGLPGSGSGALSYRAAANPASTPRTGTLTIAGKTFTVTQAGAGCTFSLSSSGANIGAGVVNGSVNVTAPGGCGWTATTNAPSWLTITGGLPGSGSGSLTYRAAANPNSTPRTGTLTIAGKTFTVTQAGAGCTFSLSSSGANIGAGVVNGSVNVTAPGGCGWTATTNAPSWLTITSSLPKSGSGTLTFRTTANPNSTARTGTLTIAGKTFTVTQAGASCTITLTPASAAFGAAGGTGALTIGTAAGCAWSAETRAPKWLQILSATSGTGPSVLAYRVLPNATGQSRDSTLRVSGVRFRVVQAAGSCAISVSPAASTFGAPGGSGMFTVSAAAGCGWSAAPGASWLTIASGSSGTGTGIVEFRVAAKTTTGSRSASVSVSGAAHTVTQQGVAASTTDADGDGLPDEWESRFGLNAGSASGQAGAVGDPDNDGLTNAAELSGGTHPRGFFRRFLAEGATGSFFGLRIALANPGVADASVLVRFQPRDGSPVSHYVSLGAMARATVSPASLPGLAAAEVATLVESDELVVVDRTMWWDAAGYGAHAETALPAPALRWYLAEGATHSGFRLFYLLQNPSAAQDAVVEVTYLRPDAPPLSETYTVTRESRFNIDVNNVPGLPPGDVSAILAVQSGPPIVVERAMYRDAPNRPFAAGHEAAGVTAPAPRWTFAEGATGAFFDLFCLIMNPTTSDADVAIRYLLPDGTTVRQDLTVPARRRRTVWADIVAPELASTAASIVVESTNGVPIVAERSMWWPFDWTRWTEAHATAGATTTARRWGLAEGEIGGPSARRTFLLVANTGSADTLVRVTLLLEGGGTRTVEELVPGGARRTIDVAAVFGPLPVARFGAVVESLDGAPLVVERAMYWNAGGEQWAAGTDALGMPLP